MPTGAAQTLDRLNAWLNADRDNRMIFLDRLRDAVNVDLIGNVDRGEELKCRFPSATSLRTAINQALDQWETADFVAPIECDAQQPPAADGVGF